MPGDQRNWRPLAYWLFDTCLSNSYVIWRSRQPQDVLASCRTHEHFTTLLIKQLLAVRDPTPTPPLSPRRTRQMSNHQPCQMERRGFCAWGRLQPQECQGRRTETLRVPRKPLSEISGNRRRINRLQKPKRVQTGCKLCIVHLCIKQDCFHKYHAQLYRNHIENAI